jgi:hypothetical protein
MRKISLVNNISVKMKNVKYELTPIYLLFCLILLAGCIWHVLGVSRLYFEYKTNVNVRFERERLVQMPAITICSNVTQTIRRDYLMKRFPLYINKITEKWILTQYLRRLTIREQLLNATVSPHQFFNSCSVMKPIAYEDRHDIEYVDCKNISEYRQYINYYVKCFTIVSQLNNENNDNYIVDYDATVRDNGFQLFHLLLNDEYLDSVNIFFHSRHTPFKGYFGGQINDLHLNTTKYSGYSLTYVKTTTELLPSPYETSCLDYNSIGYKSQSHCIAKCKANYYMKLFNGWHADIPAPEDVPDIHFASLFLRENKTLDKMMSNNCVKTCSKKENCFNEYFNIKVVEKWKKGDNTDNQSIGDKLHEILIFLPTGMITKYTHSPRLHLQEFICYAASVFSLWFGISIITFSKFIYAFLHYLTHKNDKENDIQKSDCYCFL